AVAAVCFAHAAVAKSSDRRQTMRVQADRSDCVVTDGGPCVLTGNVHIVPGSLVIEAARADIRQGDGDIQSARLTGSPVKLRQDTVVFTGGAVVQQPGRGSIAGERIVYNMRTGQVQGGGGENGGRVTLQFEPRNRTGERDAGDDGND